MPAKHVTHTVGPVYGEEQEREAELLANCYRESLTLARQHGCKTVAFPSISTGAYGYPPEEASRIALNTIREFIGQHPDALETVEIVTFSERDYRLYQQAYEKAFSAGSSHDSRP